MADWIGRRQPAGRPFGANRSAPGADHGNWLAAGQAAEPTSQTEVQNTMEIIRSAPALFGASVRRLFGASSVRRKRSAPFGAVRRQASVRRLFGAGADLSAPGAEQHCNWLVLFWGFYT